jgi:hypothetical protein
MAFGQVFGPHDRRETGKGKYMQFKTNRFRITIKVHDDGTIEITIEPIIVTLQTKA